jgi:hypothetical protein
MIPYLTRKRPSPEDSLLPNPNNVSRDLREQLQANGPSATASLDATDHGCMCL